jgi:hypothetical protein
MHRRAQIFLAANALLMVGTAIVIDLTHKSVHFLDPDSSFLGPSWLRLPLLLSVALVVDLLPRALWISRLRVRRVPHLMRERWRSYWSRERVTLVYTGLLSFYLVYISYRNLKSWLPKLRPNVQFDHELHLIDRAIFFGHEPGTIMHDIFGWSWFAWVFSSVYLWFLPLVPIAVIVWIVFMPNMKFGYWFVISDCLAWTLGTISYYALPTLGPGIEYNHVYSSLPNTPTNGLMTAIVNDRQDYIYLGQHDVLQSVAGFASLHCAITLLTALMIQYTVPWVWLKRFFWADFGVTLIATLYFGWHYVCDDVAGIMIALVSFYVGGLVSGYQFGPKRYEHRREPGSAEQAVGVPRGNGASWWRQLGRRPAAQCPVDVALSNDAAISASAASRPTQSAPSTDLPGSRSL